MRILFVKTSSLGDVVHNCPAVSEAARHAPGAAIDWVVEEAFAGVARLHPRVRRVIAVALRRWRAAPWSPAAWSQFGALRRLLAAERYDCVIDTQGLVKSALVAMLARGVKHGMDRASLREPLAARFYDVRHAVPRERHAVERNRMLAAAALGYAVDGPCEYGLAAAGAPPFEVRAPYAVLLTMSSRDAKLWPEARWVELGRALAARGVRAVLPWGSEAERARNEALAAEIPDAQVPRRMTLEELARLMRAARAVAGVDTGLSHLAVAVGTPAVGIYCASDPALTGLHGNGRARNVGRAGAPPPAAEVLAALEAVL